MKDIKNYLINESSMSKDLDVVIDNLTNLSNKYSNDLDVIVLDVLDGWTDNGTDDKLIDQIESCLDEIKNRKKK